MADPERTVEIMVCAFIAIGIIVVCGWVVFTKTNLSSYIGMNENDLKEMVPPDQYADTLGFLKQQSAGFWLITLVVAGGGLMLVYIAIVEIMAMNDRE